MALLSRFASPFVSVRSTVVRATVVRRDAEQNVVLAGNLKGLELNKTYLAGDPKRKG